MNNIPTKAYIPEGCKAIMLGKHGSNRYLAYTNTPVNKPLFDQLWNDGFFEFNLSNNGHIAYLHQIVAFYYCGGVKALANNIRICKDAYEVHHINGNTTDNRACNLAYVDTHSHTALTAEQKRFAKPVPRTDRAVQNDLGLLVWNRRGDIVYNRAKWFAHLLTRTVLETCKYYGVEPPIKHIVRWYRKVRKKLGIAAKISIERLCMGFCLQLPLT